MNEIVSERNNSGIGDSNDPGVADSGPLLDIAKHKKYFHRCLELFPSVYTSHDSSLAFLVYCCMGGLDIIGELHFAEDIRKQWIDWVYRLKVPGGEGFRGSSSHDLRDPIPNRYDRPNLAATFFCISILGMLRDENLPQRLDREKIMSYVINCQRPDGSFAPMYDDELGPFGDHDPRYNYVASGIRYLLGFGNALNSDKDIQIADAVSFLYDNKNYDGGFGQFKGSESHSGLTFCVLASLKLLNKLPSPPPRPTIHWLCHRQAVVGDNSWDLDEIGGFNGRVNKAADTCYSYWNLASLSILDQTDLMDSEANKHYLLTQTQHKLLGGFGKSAGDYPDPYHSYLALASLALTKASNHCKDFDAATALTCNTLDFIYTWYS